MSVTRALSLPGSTWANRSVRPPGAGLCGTHQSRGAAPRGHDSPFKTHIKAPVHK